MKYSDKTTKEWKELEHFYNHEYRGYLTLPEFLELNHQEWTNYENHYSNPNKDYGINESDLPFKLGTRLYEYRWINGQIYVCPYIFGTKPIPFDVQRWQNEELFLCKNTAEKLLRIKKENDFLEEVV